MHQLHAALELEPLPPDRGEILLELQGLSLELILRIDAELAVIGVEAEIGEKESRDRRYDQTAGISVLVLAGPHGALLARRAFKLDRHAALSLCLRIGFIRKPLRTFRPDALVSAMLADLA